MAKAVLKKKIVAKKAPYTLSNFYQEDFMRTLFPLSTNKILIEMGSAKISQYIDSLLLEDGGNFLPQITVHAAKDKYHLRRTVKLDVVAEYFIYDIVFRNRNRFRKPHSSDKLHYGYRFEGGEPQPPSKSYRDFKTSIWMNGIFTKNRYLTFDIASYFNNLYHHDLHAWFSALEPENPVDVEHFGKFLREINAGRSLDCLPQGLYPAKMIGNDFLRFIEDNCLIKSKSVHRFMDDICLVDEDQSNLVSDFVMIQKLLGQKGLSINSSKTRSGDAESFDESDDDIEELKKSLLKRRREVVISHYDPEDDDDEDDEHSSDQESHPLTEDEIQFAINLLNDEKLKEEDAELVLVVMRDHVNRIEKHLGLFAKDFPHLAKNFYLLCADADDKDHVASVILDVLNSGDFVGEYQLFWFGVMLEKYLMNTGKTDKLISALYNHQNGTDITRAKILEIQDNRYGLAEFREGFLREGRSDWQSWSAAVGSLALKKQARNYLLGYFKNGSPMNALIADILQS